MPEIRINDATKIYPFITTGIIDRKRRQKILEKQKSMPYTSNEGVIAVQHLNLTIKDGEFVVLLGESGCGKTTILRMISGLESPTVGEIYFDGQDMAAVKPEDRDVAMVFQNYSLYPNQNVYDNIAFPLRNQHIPREEVDEKVLEIAQLLRLSDKLERMPEDLSGGEKQRVAIARCLVRKPKIFLLDEPFSNLDVQMRATLRNELKRIQQALKITFIYVTHDQTDALILADRVIVIKDGIVQQDDNVANIYNQPVNSYVATFVGAPAMNMIEDIEVDKSGKFELLQQQYVLPTESRKKLLEDRKLTVGIRPVNIEIGKDGQLAVFNYSEEIGADFIVYLTFQGQEITAVKKVVGQQSTLIPGQTMAFKLDQQFFHYFNSEGERI